MKRNRRWTRILILPIKSVTTIPMQCLLKNLLLSLITAKIGIWIQSDFTYLRKLNVCLNVSSDVCLSRSLIHRPSNRITSLRYFRNLTLLIWVYLFNKSNLAILHIRLWWMMIFNQILLLFSNLLIQATFENNRPSILAMLFLLFQPLHRLVLELLIIGSLLVDYVVDLKLTSRSFHIPIILLYYNFIFWNIGLR